MLTILKRQFLSWLNRHGYALHPHPGRISVPAALRQARKVGLSVATIIDVGAAKGDFARQAHQVFPSARLVMVEPLSEFAASLGQIAKELPDTLLINALAADEEKSCRFNVHPDLVGSSLLIEGEKTDVNGVPRDLDAITLDQICTRYALTGPFLLKIDVQGAEMLVLRGSRQLLKQCEYLILELSFFHFFDGGPLMHELVAWLQEQGFVPYDILGISHRPLDGALAQIDMAFAKQSGVLRDSHIFATQKQRDSLTRRLRQP